MPFESDLTPEELAAFQPGAPAPAETNPESAPPQQPADEHGDRQPRMPNGQFAPRTEAAPAPADANTQPVDPNAAPTDPNTQPAPPPGYVPHAALHAERTQRQQMQQQMALLQARTNAILAQRQEQPQTQMPDLSQDPVGYVQTLEQRIAQFEQERQEEHYNRQIDTALQQDEATFASYTPDYEQASDYYVQSRAQELLHFYPPQEAQRIMVQEARQIAQQAWQRGMPAAQAVYQLAQARGYRTAQMPTPALPGLPSSVVPPAAAAQQPQPPAPAPASAVVAAVQAGQGASRSLSSATGAAPAETLNAQALLAMTDEEFAEKFGIGTKDANKRFASIAM